MTSSTAKVDIDQLLKEQVEARGDFENDEADPVPEKKPLVIVPREEWGVPPFMGVERVIEMVPHPVPDVILSYTGTPVCETDAECRKEMVKLYNDSKAKGLYDVPYNFVVGGDGTVYEGRGWNYLPEKNAEFPDLYRTSIEIAHFGERGILPTYGHIDGSWDLILKGIKDGIIRRLPGRHSLFL